MNNKKQRFMKEDIMGKFKMGDNVYFYDCQLSGIIESDNQDGTYDIIEDHGSGGGRFTVEEADIEIY
jgi:hypothetical protein